MLGNFIKILVNTSIASTIVLAYVFFNSPSRSTYLLKMLHFPVEN